MIIDKTAQVAETAHLKLGSSRPTIGFREILVRAYKRFRFGLLGSLPYSL